MKRNLLACLFHLLVFISASLGVGFVLGNIRFMGDYGRMSEAPFLVTFTGLSNLNMGIAALGCFLYRAICRKPLPIWLFLVHMISVACVSVTFLVTAVYLAPSVADQWWKLYINGSFFNHFLTPILALAGFLLLEENHGLKYRFCLFSLIPIGIYGTFYCIRAFPHVDTSKSANLYYDIYGLTRAGIPVTLLLFALFMGLFFGLTALLNLQNRTKKKND